MESEVDINGDRDAWQEGEGFKEQIKLGLKVQGWLS